MTYASLKNNLDEAAFRLRRWPVIHQPGSWLRRVLWASLKDAYWSFVRGVFASSLRFGSPAKTYSAYQALRSEWPKLNGRIILHDQGMPRVTQESLLVRSNMEQHLEQPWPIFWSEHTDARLVADTLACLTPEKALWVESAYGEKRWRDDAAARFPSAARDPFGWQLDQSRFTVGAQQVGHSNLWPLAA